MTRTGKIARLPRALRDELNRRLADGEPGIRLVAWLNGLEPVRQILAQEFGGREISVQNLSEWKQGGFRDWLTRQESLNCARELAGDAAELTSAAGGSLADHLAVVLSARYAALVSGWNGELNEAFRRELRALRSLCQDIVELRRGDHFAERLRLEAGRLAAVNKAEELKALEAVLAEIKPWPEVQQAFQSAFALYRQRADLTEPASSAHQSESNQIKPADR